MSQQLDTLFINKLTVPCIIGAFELERKEPQLVIISLALSVDTMKAGKTDDLTDTVNYHDVASRVASLVSNSQFFLLEKLAQAIADICLTDKRVKQVKVHVEKPKAIKLGSSSGIEIVRHHE